MLILLRRISSWNQNLLGIYKCSLCDILEFDLLIVDFFSFGIDWTVQVLHLKSSTTTPLHLSLSVAIISSSLKYIPSTVRFLWTLCSVHPSLSWTIPAVFFSSVSIWWLSRLFVHTWIRFKSRNTRILPSLSFCFSTYLLCTNPLTYL